MLGFRIIGGVFTGIFGIIGFLWGFISLIMAIVFLIPGFGWLNWILLPFAGCGIIFGLVATANQDTRQLGFAVLILCGISLGLAFLRLHLGGGIL